MFLAFYVGFAVHVSCIISKFPFTLLSATYLVLIYYPLPLSISHGSDWPSSLQRAIKSNRIL
jgi:hypothetical protein